MRRTDGREVDRGFVSEQQSCDGLTSCERTAGGKRDSRSRAIPPRHGAQRRGKYSPRGSEPSLQPTVEVVEQRSDCRWSRPPHGSHNRPLPLQRRARQRPTLRTHRSAIRSRASRRSVPRRSGPAPRSLTKLWFSSSVRSDDPKSYEITCRTTWRKDSSSTPACGRG